MTEPTVSTAAKPIDALIAGYRRFRSGEWTEERARWSELATGQSPKVLMIACSDSRVDPSQIFDVSPGEIFVVRNIAALVPPFETTPGRHGVSAALEFAVTQLKVEEIVVIGHGFCGGVKASMKKLFTDAKPGEGGFVAEWISMLDEPRDRVAAAEGDGDAACGTLELEAVKTSLTNLRTFPFVQEAEAAGRLALRGAHFAIADGKLKLLDEAAGTFSAVE